MLVVETLVISIDPGTQCKLKYFAENITIMVFIKPDITAGDVLEHHDTADAQVPVPVRYDDETDEEPDVEDIEVE